MHLSERELRELIEIEAGLARADPRYVQRCGAICRQIVLRAADRPRPARGWRRILHPRRYRER